MFKNLNARALGVTGHQSEIIELALTYSFRGIDVDVVEIAHRAAKHGMPYARRLIDSAGIRLGSFPLPVAFDGDEERFNKQLAKLPEYAEVAAEIGCLRCVATVAPAGDERPYHENFEFHRHRLTEVCKALEPSGVRLGLDFRASEDLRKGKAFQFIHDLDALSLLTNMIGAENVGLSLDIWDMALAGGSAETVRAMKAEHLVTVQVADLPEEVPDSEVTEAHRTLPATTGRIDVPAIVAALKEIGYDGPVTPRPAKVTLDATRRDPIVREASEAMDQVWREAGLTGERRVAVTSES